VTSGKIGNPVNNSAAQPTGQARLAGRAAAHRPACRLPETKIPGDELRECIRSGSVGVRSGIWIEGPGVRGRMVWAPGWLAVFPGSDRFVAEVL